MKKQNTLCLFLFLFCSIPYFLQAQISFTEPIHPSPTAAGLGQFGDYPVSPHTGVPNISIPIYSLQEGPINLNVSLSYHGSGIRVDQVASWVGLGWTLQAGGVITRTVMGTPDEGGSSGQGTPNLGAESNRRGWYEAYGMPPMLRDAQCVNNPIQTYGPSTFNNCKDYYEYAGEGHIDSEPDLFSFNFGSYSGKFVFDNERKVRIIQDQDIEIIPLNDQLNEWKIIAPDGTKYFFGGSTATEHTYSGVQGGVLVADYLRNISSYYLYKIESVNGDHCISLNYESEKYSFSNRTGHALSVPSDQAQSAGILIPSTTQQQTAETSQAITSVDGKRLSSIVCSSGLTEIEFVAETTRTDLKKYGSYFGVNEEAKQLSRINIIRGSNTKNFEFDIQHFNSGSVGVPNVDPTWEDDDKTRLKLVSVREKSGIDMINKYEFSYNENIIMPRRLSLARDYWGFYNGADNNTGLLPSGIPKNYTPNTSDTWSSNSDRAPDETKMQAWVLTEIKFPTGGATKFFYGAHEDGLTSQMVGGLRVEKIETDGENGSDKLITNYTYGPGHLFSPYPTSDDFSLVPDKANYTYFPGAGFPLSYVEYLTANPPSSLIAIQGNHIGYFHVEEDKGDNGKITYYYKNASPNPYTMGQPNSEFPTVPLQSALLTGTLDRIEYHNESGSLVREVNYSYNIDSIADIKASVVNLQGTTVWDNSNQQASYDNVVFVRDYHIYSGRVQLSSTSETIDGVTTVTENLDYVDQHTIPKKIRITDSENKQGETITSYSFESALAESSLPSNYATCLSNFYSDMATTRSNYESWVPPNNGEPGYTTILGPDQPLYEQAIHLAQSTFVTCLNSSVSSQNTAITNHLNTLNAEEKAMLERHMLIPLEVNQKYNGQVISGTKVEYDLLSLDPNKADYLLPDKYFKLEIDPTTFSSTWSEEVQVVYDDHSNVIQNKHPLSQAAAYIYARGQILPTAKILSANSDQVAYTSFELATLDEKEHGSWKIVDQATINSSTIPGTLVAGGSSSQTRVLQDANPQNQVSVTFTASMPGCGNPPSGNPNECNLNLAIVNLVTGATSYPSFGINGESITLSFDQGQYQFSIVDCDNSNGSTCTTSDAFSVAYSYTNTWNEYPGFSQAISGKTGEKAFYLNGNNSITRTGLPSGEYIVSYFKKNGSVSVTISGGSKTIISHNPDPDGWELEENIISINGPSSTITLSANSTVEIDELRLHPRFAQMSTYTYDDAFRVHTITDINSRSTYYKYDGLRRLEYILDQDGNYVQSMEYNFRP